MPGRPKEFDRGDALQGAIEVFWSRGYEASSVAMLLDSMKINRQSAYDTFGDKRELFMHALNEYAGKVAGEFGQLLSEGKSPLGRVRKFLEAIRQRATGKGVHNGCLLCNTLVEVGPHDREVRELISAIFKKLEDRLAELLKEAVKAGEISKKRDPRQLARFVLMVMQGALVLSKANLDAAVNDAIAVAEGALTA